MDLKKWLMKILDAVPRKDYDQVVQVYIDTLDSYNGIIEKVAKETKNNKLEQYFNNKYPKTNKLYFGRYFASKKLPLDPRVLLNKHDVTVQKISKKFKGTDDEKMLQALKWVRKNIEYESDEKVTGFKEFWNFPFETLAQGEADCEDGAVLLYCLAWCAGVPYWKLRVTAGWVKTPGKQDKSGHAYLTYYCENKDKWVIVDWCYYYNSKTMSERPAYKTEEFYDDVWFSWNCKHCFAKSTKDLKWLK